MKQLILGSKSPRRQQILKQAGFDFKVITSDEDEVIDPTISPEKVPVYLAIQKALYIEPLITESDYILLTADTIVLVDDEIVGKPEDLESAKYYLQGLSGRTHQVISGVCIKTEKTIVSFSDTANVTFKTLTEQEIDYYLENYVVLDKAGAYAIQEWIGLIGITKIEGSYYNIMGLPIQKVYEKLQNLI